MSDEISTQAGEIATLPAVQEGCLIPNFAPATEVEKDFETLAASASWLSRIQLFGGNSDRVKEGKIGVGTYGFVQDKETVISLGAEVDVLVISWRPLAVATQDDPIVSSHDRNSAVFKDIENRANNEKDSGCVYGPEFLLWIPSLKKYATFLLGSKSFRREAPVLKGFMSRGATLKAKLVTADRFKWHVPVVTPCSTPFELPLMDDLAATAETFKNPPVRKTPDKIETTSVNPGRAT